MSSLPALVIPEATSNRWQPKAWRPEYTEMVTLSSLGMSHKAISDEIFKRTGTRYTTQHVSNVMCTRQGKALMEMISRNLQAHVEKTIPERLEAIAHKTIERLEVMMNDDKLFEKAPFAVIDRGMKIAVSTGHIKSESSGSGANNKFFIPVEAMKGLIEAMKISENVQTVHAEIVDADVVTA